MRRRLPLVLAIAAFFGAAIWWIVADRRASRHAYDHYSTANTSDHGLSLAYAYLGREGRRVAMLTKPLDREPIPRNAVLFRVAETIAPPFDLAALQEEEDDDKRTTKKANPLLSEAEDALVRRGGRVVLAADEIFPTHYGKADKARKVFPLWPRPNTLHLPKPRAFETIGPRMHAIFTAEGKAVVARERIGEGELFVVSVPEVFRNDHLAAEDNLAFVAALAGKGRPVYFDETVHGIVSGDGHIEMMKDWNLGPLLMLGAFAAILLYWRRGRRVGPPEDDYRETRSDAVDLVHSLGALYRRASTDGDALALYHDALSRTVAMQTGLRGDALKAKVNTLTGGLLPPAAARKLDPATFQLHLDTINRAFAKVERRGETHAHHR